MKFTIQCQTLMQLLAAVSKATPSRSEDPILMNLLFELKKDMLRITATDGQITLRGLAKTDSVESEGKTTIPAKLLLELVKTLPSENITFTLQEKTIDIFWSTGESSIPVMSPESYPEIRVPDKNSEFGFTTTSDILIKAIGKTSFAADASDKHPALAGILFDNVSGQTSLVASDSQKLVVNVIKTENTKKDSLFTLPLRASLILKSILPKETPVTVIHDDKSVRFVFGSTELSCQTIAEKFPAYQTIIPKNNTNVLTLSKDDLLMVLNRMSIVADKKTPIVKVSITSDKVQLEAQDLGLSTKGKETLPCKYDGEDITIGLKTYIISQSIANIETEEISISIENAKRAFLITPSGEGAEEENYKAVVMPYKVK